MHASHPSRLCSRLSQIKRTIVVLGCKDLINQFTTIPFRISKKNQDTKCGHLHAPFSQLTCFTSNILKGGLKTSRKAFLTLKTSHRLGGYAHVGDAVPPTQYIHFHTKIQQHNITHKATPASLSKHHRQPT